MERSTEKTAVISHDVGTIAAEGRTQRETVPPVVCIAHNEDDLGDGTFEFRVDNDAEPRDAVPALARLLIGLARRHRGHKAHEAAAV